MKVKTIADTIGGTVTEVKQGRNLRYSKKDQACSGNGLGCINHLFYFVYNN